MPVDPIEERDREHDHEFLDKELDPYPQYDMGKMDSRCHGDVCPRCGVPLVYKETAIRFDGEKGKVYELKEESVLPPAYHPRCWEKRQAEADGQEDTSLGDYE